MPLKKLFLAHYGGDAEEVHQLAMELRLRGIAPWVDKLGGFLLGDDSEDAARRAIREDCFGLLLYATEHVFARPFIRDVELAEACAVHQNDPTFVLVAVPRVIDFAELRRRSRRSFKVDLSKFHSVPVPANADLDSALARVGSEVLTKALRRARTAGEGKVFSLQFSTRELFPDEPEDILRVDATALLANAIGDPFAWERLMTALRDIRREIGATFGRPRLRVHGSKHLSAAFLFGRVFAPFEMDIRQTPEQVWRTDADSTGDAPFNVSLVPGAGADGRLFVEITSGYKNIAAGVDALIATRWVQPSTHLQFRPPYGQTLQVDSALCRAMVRQVYTELDQTCHRHTIREIHLFAAVPQAFLMMLGREFKGMPPTWVYEWTGNAYVGSCCIPGGVL